MNDIIPITVSSFNRLYLTHAELRRLVERIEQELVCRTATQVDEPVIVADMSLPAAEAWRLLRKLEDLVTEDQINWAIEGF